MLSAEDSESAMDAESTRDANERPRRAKGRSGASSKHPSIKTWCKIEVAASRTSCDLDTAIEHTLEKWWSEQIAFDKRAVPPNDPTDPNASIVPDLTTVPWGGLLLHALPSDLKSAREELFETPLSTWIERCGPYDAMLLYRVCRRVITANEQEPTVIVVHGKLTYHFLSKMMRVDSNEMSANTILESHTLTVGESTRREHQFVKYGTGQWIYHDIGVDPAEYGPEERAYVDANMQNHMVYDKLVGDFGELVHKLTKIERNFPDALASEEQLASYWHTFRRIVCEKYMPNMDFSRPDYRYFDKRMREFLFYHYLMTEDAKQRAIIENVTAHLVQAVVEIGWPYEKHITHLLRAMKPKYPPVPESGEAHSFPIESVPLDDVRIACDSIRNGGSASEHRDSSHRRAGEDRAGDSDPRKCSAPALFPLVVHPDDTVDSLRSRFVRTIEEASHDLELFSFDNDDSGEGDDKDDGALIDSGDNPCPSSLAAHIGPSIQRQASGQMSYRTEETHPLSFGPPQRNHGSTTTTATAMLRFVNPAQAISARLKDMSNLVIAKSRDGKCFASAEPDSLFPKGWWRQVVLDAFPTRLYFVVRSVPGSDAEREDMLMQSMGFEVMKRFSSVEHRAGLGSRAQTHVRDPPPSSSSSDNRHLLEDSHLLRLASIVRRYELSDSASDVRCAERTTIYVFPIAVFPSLSSLRSAVRSVISESNEIQTLPDSEVYEDGTAFRSLTWMGLEEVDDDFALQPSMRQLCRSFRARSELGSPPAPSRLLASETSASGSPNGASHGENSGIEDGFLVPEDVEDAVRETLERFPERSSSRFGGRVAPLPSSLWIKPEQHFSANCGHESADAKKLVKVEMRSSLLGQTGRVPYGGRVVSYIDIPYWLGSLARFRMRHEYEFVYAAQYNGDPRAYFVGRGLFRDVDAFLEQFSRIRACFRGESSSYSSPDAMSSHSSLPRAPGTKNRRAIDLSAVTTSESRGGVSLDEANRVKTATASTANGSGEECDDERVASVLSRERESIKRKSDAAQEALLAPHRAKNPGSFKEMKAEESYADSCGSEFLHFVYARDSAIDPKSSISIKTVPSSHNPSEVTFIWSDLKTQSTRRMGDCGAYKLALYKIATDDFNIDRETLCEAKAAFKEHLEFKRQRIDRDEKRQHRSRKEEPNVPHWTSVASGLIDEQIKKAFLSKDASSRGLLHTAETLVRHIIRAFYASKHGGSGDGAVSLSDAASASLGLSTASQREALASKAKNGGGEKAPIDEDPGVLEVREQARQSVPIAESSAHQRYLRGERGLSEISRDILEGNPWVRAHPALTYRAQSNPDSRGTRRGKNPRMVYPALILLCSDQKTGAIVGAQRIFIDESNNRKVSYENPKQNPAKKSRGRFTDTAAVFFVQPGRLELVPIVFVAEGPETAWSVASASRYMCVYATFGIGNFAAFRRHKDDSTRPAVCLCLDREHERNDDERRKASINRNTVAAAIRTLRRAGWRDVLARMPDCDDGCKDFNEVHQKHGIGAVRRMFETPDRLGVMELPLAGDSFEDPLREWTRSGVALVHCESGLATASHLASDDSQIFQ